MHRIRIARITQFRIRGRSEPVWSQPPFGADADLQAVDADELRAEAALLEQVRQVLARSPESAERILRDFEVRFRTPALGFERDLLRVETLAALGETKRALSQARALQGKSPNSVYGDRVAALVARLESSSSRENPPASMKDSGRIGNQ